VLLGLARTIAAVVVLGEARVVTIIALPNAEVSPLPAPPPQMEDTPHVKRLS